MAASSYFPFFMMAVTVVCVFFGLRYFPSQDYSLQEEGQRNAFLCIIICTILIFWMGMRPISNHFGDTINYAYTYARLDSTMTDGADVDWGDEWLFSWIMFQCYSLGMTTSGFFTVIEFGYITSLFLAIWILMPKNPMLGLLFALASFSFFTFGVNGIRNGLSVHIALLAMALFLSDRKFLSLALFAAAFGIHKSSILPIGCFFMAIYAIKDPKFAIFIWLMSIPVSFFAGYYFVNIFSTLGFDDRVSQYLTVSEGQALEDATSAFRWDFLLYSAMPVLMSYVVIIKRQVTDKWYNVLATTYCLSNAFWVLVIRASFTNRFAYLSWFMYPVVIAYPLIMLPVWEDQDNKIGVILAAYVLLTLGICYFTHMFD